MKTFKILFVLFLIAGLFIGCSTTKTPTTTPATTPAASPATTAPTSGGGDKASVEAYVISLKPLEEEMTANTKEWDELVAGADKMKAEELSTKIDEHLEKHEAFKTKVTALKADNDDTKAHQGVIIEVIDLQVVNHTALKDKYTKKDMKPEEKTKIEEDIKKGEEAVKTKIEDMKKKFDEMLTKYEIKKDEGTSSTGTDTATPAASATPTDAATPASSPTSH